MAKYNIFMKLFFYPLDYPSILNLGFLFSGASLVYCSTLLYDVWSHLWLCEYTLCDSNTLIHLAHDNPPTGSLIGAVCTTKEK